MTTTARRSWCAPERGAIVASPEGPHLLLAQAISIDGGEYLLVPASSPRQSGYEPLGAAESRWALRDWAHRHGISAITELCRQLGSWRSSELPSDVDTAVELLDERFDDYTPELVLLRRVPVEVELDLSPIEEVVDLSQEISLTEDEPELHWVQITFHDADGTPMADAQCRIELPDGVVHEGRTNAAGVLRVADISMAGPCKVSFPELEAYVRQRAEAPA